MTESKIISWDLDETLGYFRDIVSAKGRGEYPDPQDKYVLRKDIIKTLNHMIRNGYQHVLTSSAKSNYSQKVLQAACLDAYFDHVFTRERITDGIWGKRYCPVAEAYQLDEDEACSRILIIANMSSDEPTDLGLVFLHDRRGVEESALVYQTIADTLWTRGDGSFKRGFEAVFEAGRKVSCLDKDFDFMLVSTNISDGIAVKMGYKNSPCTEGLKIPVIQDVQTA